MQRNGNAAAGPNLACCKAGKLAYDQSKLSAAGSECPCRATRILGHNGQGLSNSVASWLARWLSSTLLDYPAAGLGCRRARPAFCSSAVSAERRGALLLLALLPVQGHGGCVTGELGEGGLRRAASAWESALEGSSSLPAGAGA